MAKIWLNDKKYFRLLQFKTKVTWHLSTMRKTLIILLFFLTKPEKVQKWVISPFDCCRKALVITTVSMGLLSNCSCFNYISKIYFDNHRSRSTFSDAHKPRMSVPTLCTIPPGIRKVEIVNEKWHVRKLKKKTSQMFRVQNRFSMSLNENRNFW